MALAVPLRGAQPDYINKHHEWDLPLSSIDVRIQSSCTRSSQVVSCLTTFLAQCSLANHDTRPQLSFLNVLKPCPVLNVQSWNSHLYFAPYHSILHEPDWPLFLYFRLFYIKQMTDNFFADGSLVSEVPAQGECVLGYQVWCFNSGLCHKFLL